MSIKSSRGQATVITVVFITVLLGFSALAIDVGSWWKAKRDLQATADAAALAGAQALPESPDDARALAIQYASTNGGTLDPNNVTFTRGVSDHDTVNVSLSAPAPGFFSKVFGIDSVTVGARASARTANVSAALRVAPIVVNEQHPMLACHPLPCPDETEIDLADLHQPHGGDAAGSFGLINLHPNSNGTVGDSVLAGWITHGYDDYMEIGDYNAVPSSQFNSSNVRDAMEESIGQVLLFPIYRSIHHPGQNAEYDIIGWVGFHVTGFDPHGSSARVYGWFTRRISEGIQVTSGSSTPDYGVRAVQLVN